MSRHFYDIDPLLSLVDAGYTLLTPTARLSRRIKAEWDGRNAASDKVVWEPLPVQPLESWLLAQWERALVMGLVPPLAPLKPAQQLQLWQQVIAEEERQSGDYHLLRPSAAAELANQARENLLRWEQDMSSESIRQCFKLDADCGTFLRWFDLFEQRLDQAGQCTPVDCVRALAGCHGSLAPARVVLVEFDDIPPLFRSTVTQMCEDVREYQPEGSTGERLAHALGDKRAELQAIARWARDTSAREPASSIGIVLSDMRGDRTSLEYLLRREFGCLGDNYSALPVNFSTGISLDRAPVVRDALQALTMGQRQVRVADVVQLLHSRFLDMPDANSPLANRFITRLYDAGREQVEPGELRYAANEVKLGESKGLLLGQHLLALSGMRELRQASLPSAWVPKFNAVLDQWGWPGAGPLDSLEYQQVELWYRTLDEFRAYDAVCGPLELDEALQLLRNSCTGQVSQPQTRDSNIQVLGPLEAAGLGFDHLWLCGMQGGAWPAPARPNPFIPMVLQRQAQMPHATAEREWAFGETLFRQYLRSSGVIHASYCEQLQGVPELPSAFLQDFQWQEIPPAELVDPSWIDRRQRRNMEWLEDAQAPALTREEQQSMRGGSGLLEDQSQCPFRAFARRRLGVEPLSAFSVALSPADRGSLLHDALYSLWGEIKDHQSLLAMDEVEQGCAVQNAVRDAIETIPGGRRRQLGGAYWELEQRRLQSLLQEWLTVERQRGEFVVLHREQDIPLQLDQLHLSLRVDRVDQLPDGSQLIIDYKSGLSRVQDWMGERPARPQLLLYGIAAPGSAAGLAFAQVRPRDSRFVGLGRTTSVPGIRSDIAKVVKEQMDADDWDSLNQRWTENLQRLAAEFVSGEAQVDPVGPSSCTWCGLQPLCRIGMDQEAAQ